MRGGGGEEEADKWRKREGKRTCQTIQRRGEEDVQDE
jgi:hypothetical protein